MIEQIMKKRCKKNPASAELEEDATPKSLIEEVFSIEMCTL